jgi:uncharacterized protein YutE (UPF0331/DUF86 family)
MGMQIMKKAEYIEDYLEICEEQLVELKEKVKTDDTYRLAIAQIEGTIDGLKYALDK